MSKVYSVEEARKKMEYFCSYQDRCHAEVSARLRDMGMISQAIDVIMTKLIQDNYLNEERFARSFARGKHRIKGWGIPRITSELKLRSISLANIKAALTEIPADDYHENFDKLAEKKWQTTLEKDLLKKKKKVADFLLRKGFESQLVLDKIHQLGKS
ncbi:regulatory protein RecX [Flavobacterium silvaticum]|uniref:Regulatory protein RecX n=1 Tax=Flavobacterium silvaticum TaxID=1852020 RepID=A0A972JIG5_9FLAO|nr:regulatory protein RecX [Flavobacterium silvaticum]NMH28213.1 RecX family transcriptional regulator [Flavobacterium silvaticum]